MAYKVAFYTATNNNLWSALQQWGIRIWTLGKYSHCEFIDDNGSDNPNDWTWMAATSRDPGVTAVRKIKFKPGNWDVYDLPSDVDYQPAVKWAMSNLGKKYDWTGIWLSQFLQLNINNPNRYFCSEFNMKQLQETALLRGDTAKPQSYSPNGMYRKLKKMGALKKWQK